MAVNVDAVANVIGKKYSPEPEPADVLVAAQAGCEAAAVAQAEQLRAKGLCVEFALDAEDAVDFAKAHQIARVLLVGAEGVKEVRTDE